jgi:hypothetical protein
VTKIPMRSFRQSSIFPLSREDGSGKKILLSTKFCKKSNTSKHSEMNIYGTERLGSVGTLGNHDR